MSKNVFKLVMAMFICLASPLSVGAVSDKSLDRLVELSGLEEQVSQFPAVIKAGVYQAIQEGEETSAEEQLVLLNSVDKAIVPSQMLKSIKESLASTLSEREVNDLLFWYDSELAKEITEAEKRASTPEAFQGVINEAAALVQRADLIEYSRQLDLLLGMTDKTVELQEKSSTAVYLAMMTVMQPGEPVDVSPLKQQLESMRAQMRADTEQMVILSFAYTYKSLDKEKLEKYKLFLSTPSATKFNKFVMNSMFGELEVAIANWAKELASLLQKDIKSGA